MGRALIALSTIAAIALSGWLVHGDDGPDRTVWTVSGRRILVNGAPFFAKGCNYSPAPVGASGNWSPFGDWFTRPWHEIYERDMPKLRDMGANSIRLHSWYALEPTEQNYRRSRVLDMEKEATNDHSHFLDMAWNYGKNPMYVLITIPLEKPRVFYFGSDQRRIEDSAEVFRFYERTAAWAARKYGKHPAVMGFSVGNECNDEPERLANPLFWTRMSTLAKIIKELAPDKLVMTAWFPHPRDHFVRCPQMLLSDDFDVIGMNLYDIQLKFSEFLDLYRLICVNGGKDRPVLVTEFGAPACEHLADGQMAATPVSIAKQRQWVERIWKEIVLHSVQRNPHRGIVSGGYVFSWSDEWWKTRDSHGSAAVQDASEINDSPLANGWLDEECFGVNAVRPHPSRPALFPRDKATGRPHAADILRPREVYYSLKALWADEKEQEDVPRYGAGKEK